LESYFDIFASMEGEYFTVPAL